MSQTKTLLPPNEYADMILEVGLILDIGKPPRLEDKNEFGIDYSQKYVDYLENKVKALAKAHLYLASMKSKFQEIEHYLRWHPNGKDAEDYKSLLNSYESQFDLIKKQLKSNKEDKLPLAKNELQMAERSKMHHETVEIPAAKLMIEQMNHEKKAFNAQKEAYNVLKSLEKKEYNEAKKIHNDRLREIGLEPIEEDLENRKKMDERRKKLGREAEEAWARERQKLVNIAEGKFEGWNKINEKRFQKYGILPRSRLRNDSLFQKIEANRQARFNALRARKRNKSLAKQSQTRRARKTRKLK